MLLLAMEYSILQVHMVKDEKNDISAPSKGFQFLCFSCLEVLVSISSLMYINT